MDTIVFTASERSDVKKGTTRRLRREGKIPGIVYGHMGTVPIFVDAHAFRSKFHHLSENTIINLTVGDRAYNVLIKDYQTNILKGSIEHLDFYAIQSDKPVRTHIPIHFFGSSKGVREGGIMEVQLHALDVECLPKDLIPEIKVDITSLEAGHAIHVKDLILPQEIKSLSFPEQVVVSVVHTRMETSKQQAATDAATDETAASASSESGKSPSSKSTSEKK